MRKHVVCLVALLAIVSTVAAATWLPPIRSKPPQTSDTNRLTAAISLDEINDREIMLQLLRAGTRFKASGQGASIDELLKQAERNKCDLSLAREPTAPLDTRHLIEKYRAGVLVVARHYKCPKCTKWHLGTASGFMLTTDGAFATCLHVLERGHEDSLLILTGDGRVAPVIETLAANPRADLIVLKAQGDGYTPVPLSTEAPVGSTVRVYSHPEQQFYYLSEGFVSRYYRMPSKVKGQWYTAMSITADFAKGSSGAPVFNEAGAVVAMVNNTHSVYYSVTNNVKDNLQMVFKNCVPTTHLLEMVDRN